MLLLTTHDPAFLFQIAEPALRECWRSRSFKPAKELFAQLRQFLVRYEERFRVGRTEVVCSPHLPWDRAIWRHVVGEVLQYGALEIANADFDLELLVAVGGESVRPALKGSEPIRFGGGYRESFSGLHRPGQVPEVDGQLAAIDSSRWKLPEDFRIELVEADRADELHVAHESLCALIDFYRNAANSGRAVVCEWFE